MDVVTNGLSKFAHEIYAKPWIAAITCVTTAAAFFFLPSLPYVAGTGVASYLLSGLGDNFGDNRNIESALGSNIQDAKIRGLAKRVLKTIPIEQRQTFVQQASTFFTSTDVALQKSFFHCIDGMPANDKVRFVSQLNRLNLLPEDRQKGMEFLQTMDSGDERETFVTQLLSLNISQEKRLVYAEILKTIPPGKRLIIINQINALGNPSMAPGEIEKSRRCSSQ